MATTLEIVLLTCVKLVEWVTTVDRINTSAMSGRWLNASVSPSYIVAICS
ncbi:MAG: hypothetical protein ACR2QO_26555 [Acidimicrobiales bacterium]